MKNVLASLTASRPATESTSVSGGDAKATSTTGPSSFSQTLSSVSGKAAEKTTTPSPTASTPQADKHAAPASEAAAKPVDPALAGEASLALTTPTTLDKPGDAPKRAGSADEDKDDKADNPASTTLAGLAGALVTAVPVQIQKAAAPGTPSTQAASRSSQAPILAANATPTPKVTGDAELSEAALAKLGKTQQGLLPTQTHSTGSTPLTAGKLQAVPSSAAPEEAAPLVSPQAFLAQIDHARALLQNEADGTGQAITLGGSQGVALPMNPTLATGAVSVPVGSADWSSTLGQAVAEVASSTPSLSSKTVQLRLDPPNLGPLTVTVSMAGASAHVNLVSPHDAVRQALAASMPALNHALAQQGLSLGQASVGGDGRQNGFAAFSFSGGGQSGRQASPEHTPPDSTIVAEDLGRAPALPVASTRLVDTQA